MTKKKDKSPASEPEETAPASAEQDALQVERDALFEKLQRVSADYANYQRRVPKQIADSVAYEKEKVFRLLLPVLDNLERTLASVENTEAVDGLVKGVQMIYDQMLDTLGGLGVEQIKAVGEMFDPTLHEAMMRRSESEQADNVVLEEYQKGYRLKDRVLRPSKVIVNKLENIAAEEADAPASDEAASEAVETTGDTDQEV